MKRCPTSCHWRNANSNHKELQLLGWLTLEGKKTSNTDANKKMKLLDHTYITSKYTNSYRHFR